MTATSSKNFERAMKLLDEIGMLLVTGSEIPDVCRLVTTERFGGSWWGSSFAREIFAVNEMLSDHDDVTVRNTPALVNFHGRQQNS